MSLFQHAVTNKYLAGLSKPALNDAYTRFAGYFHDPQRQQNIRNAKEEQYQEGFLRELFVQVLGYTLNPDPGFNLTTEHRNVKDSRKADGAILFNGDVVGVIELKGADTTDLTKVENQAFGYKNNQPGCRYVIISNFEKLRFYIDNAIDHLEFNLFTLDRKGFELLWLCLSDKILTLNKDLHSLTSQFYRTLQRHFGMAEIPAKLNNWYQMGYGEFVKELRKRKVAFTLAQEAEWEGYFEAEAAKALELKRTIDATDREIDRMVYELYGLTEEEIAVVEGKETRTETMDQRENSN